MQGTCRLPKLSFLIGQALGEGQRIKSYLFKEISQLISQCDHRWNFCSIWWIGVELEKALLML